jgi:MFS family permease
VRGGQKLPLFSFFSLEFRQKFSTVFLISGGYPTIFAPHFTAIRMEQTPQTYNRNLVFAAACAGILLFGIGLISLGALLNEIILKYGITQVAAGTLTLVLALGIMAGSLVFGPVVDRYGYKSMMVVCTLLVIAGMLGLAFAQSLFGLEVAVFLIGAGGGALNGGTSALVIDISQPGRGGSDLSLLGVFWGVGALGMPLILGALSSRFSYEAILAATGLAMFIPAVYFALLTFPQPKVEQGIPLKAGISLLSDPILLSIGMVLFFQSGVESLVNNWSTNFLINYRSIDPGNAKYALSVYVLALTLGRLSIGAWLRHIQAYKTLAAGMGLTVLGILLLQFSPLYSLNMVGMFLIGAGVAAGFPLMLGYVGEIYKHLSGTAFSVVFVLALIGNMIINYLTGIISELYGISTLPILMICGMAFLILTFIIALQKVRKKTTI